MEKNKTLTGLAISLMVCFFLLGGLLVLVTTPQGKTVTVPTDRVVIQEKVVDLSELTAKVDSISNTINEQDNWEDEAILLAITEWSAKDNKDVFNAIDDLTSNIEDKEDISSIVCTDEEVTSSDVDEQNAVVVQELKVKYEDSDGDNKKVYLIVTTTIEDNEVVDQEFELA